MCLWGALSSPTETLNAFVGDTAGTPRPSSAESSLSSNRLDTALQPGSSHSGVINYELLVYGDTVSTWKHYPKIRGNSLVLNSSDGKGFGQNLLEVSKYLGKRYCWFPETHRG